LELATELVEILLLLWSEITCLMLKVAIEEWVVGLAAIIVAFSLTASADDRGCLTMKAHLAS
jgi:hypothetical protein